MATQTHERKRTPSKGSKVRGKRNRGRAQVDLDVKHVDESPEAVEKRRQAQGGPGAPGVPVVLTPEAKAEKDAAAGHATDTSDDDDGDGVEDEQRHVHAIAVEDDMILDCIDDEEGNRLNITRLWQTIARWLEEEEEAQAASAREEQAEAEPAREREEDLELALDDEDDDPRDGVSQRQH